MRRSYLTKYGDTLKFTLIFPKVPSDWDVELNETLPGGCFLALLFTNLTAQPIFSK
jgi:hypothetical protein